MRQRNRQIDTFDRRSHDLQQYRIRCIFIMGAAAGLLFLADSELLFKNQKVTLIIWDFANILVGFSALLGFEDAILNIEYQVKVNRNDGQRRVRSAKWPLRDVQRYYIALLSTITLAVILVIWIIINKPSKETKIIYGTSIFTIGPFVEGYDSLSPPNSTLQQLKDSICRPSRTYTEIDIYGGVDKRPLIGVSKTIYGDNISLAQSRAEWMKKHLQNFNCVSNTCLFFTGVNGAKKYSSKYTFDDYASSRYVIIRGKYLDTLK